MTLINYDFQKELISNGKREDGRGLTEYREFSAEVGLIDNANGSAKVKFGNTEVLAGVKFSVGTPYPDSPDEGMFMVNMELNPLSSPDYEQALQSQKLMKFQELLTELSENLKH